MMGDNRHNSEDARYWGFVPFDHIVGKPLFIFFSRDLSSNKSYFSTIRWNRMFTSVHAKGEPKSYLWYVIAGIVLLWGGTYIRRKRKENS
jgi:signal peptidase I